MSISSRTNSEAELLSGLPRRLGGYRRAALESLVHELSGRLCSITRQRDEVEQRRARVATDLDRLDIEIEELLRVIELSREVASRMTADAREEYERTMKQARQEAARMEPETPPEVEDLEREVAELRASLAARRARFEQALRASLDDLAGPGPNGESVTDALTGVVSRLRPGQPDWPERFVPEVP